MAAAASHWFAGESRCLCRTQGPSLRDSTISLHRRKSLRFQRYMIWHPRFYYCSPPLVSAFGSHITHEPFTCRRQCTRWTGLKRSITTCISKPLGPALSPFAGRAKSGLACLTRTASRRCRSSAFKVDNRELIVGDVLGIVCFCLYKQVGLPCFALMHTALVSGRAGEVALVSSLLSSST